MSKDPASNVMNREVIQARQGSEIPTLPYLAVRGHLCFRCLLPAKKLTKCAGCKRAGYCGKDCQTRDWKLQHKKDCKILKNINELERQDTTSSRSRDEWTKSLLTKVKLVWSITKDENPMNIIQRQPYCTRCHRSAQQLPSGTILMPCSTCYLVSTCSSCTSLHPPEECKKYQQLGSIENFQIAHFNSGGQVYSQAPTGKPRTHYRALSTANNWYEYFADISDKKGHIENLFTTDFQLNEPLLAQADPETQASIQRMWLFFLTSTETGTMPLTVLSALEDTIPDLATKENLTIHFIGCALKEIQNSIIFEELFHLLPALQKMKMVMIGPGVPKGQTTEEVRDMEMDCCPACSERGRTRVMALYQGLYHDLAKLPQYEKPNLAVLFHSGRSQEEKESWQPTTRLLIDSSTPTVCTTYTKREATEEIVELAALGAKMIKNSEVNTWKSLIPLIEPLEGDEHTFFYHNYYRYIFQGKE